MQPYPYLQHLIAELRRRKVVGVAVAYVVVAWGLLQVAGTILQLLAAPAWIGPVILAVLAAGFPLTVVLAWLFDAQPRTTHLLAAGSIIIITLGTGFAVWDRPSKPKELEFTQLTNFAEAATAPALSPDGRMLVFLKGRGLFGNSAAQSQVYIKQLPNGADVQLTHSPSGKATPAFTPDGARVVFTAANGQANWDTHVVSMNGGHESRLLPNASGLAFLAGDTAVFAEIRSGWHMGIRRATLTREAQRDIYWPSEDGMAHRVAPSPDKKSALVVEMEAGVWQRCRLVPLDGPSKGRVVGPKGGCTYAAWSPDGEWMYFSSNAGGAFHLWRQRLRRGEADQLTHGPTEEEGIAVAADGRSLITSAGVRHNAIHLLENEQHRQISVEAYAFLPVASRDGRRIYYLSRDGASHRAYDIGQLMVMSLHDGTREEVLPGYRMVHFSLSADDKLVVFTSADDDAARTGIWIAPLDRSAAPRRIYEGQTERVLLDPAGNVYFLKRLSDGRALRRLRAPDYNFTERLHEGSVRFIFSISRNGDWIAAIANMPGTSQLQQVAISTLGMPARVICALCLGGGGPARVMAPALSWTRDGSTLLVSAQFHSRGFGMPGPPFTVAVPLQPDSAFPPLPPGGVTSIDDYLKLPGARRIALQNVLPGANANQLLSYETTTLRNLYRVKLR